MRLVVAALATGRLRFLTYPHRTGGLTSGSANVVYVDGWATRGRAKLGRAHVQARCVARVCCALALRYKRSLHKETIFLPSQLHRCMRRDSLEICHS